MGMSGCGTSIALVLVLLIIIMCRVDSYEYFFNIIGICAFWR